MVNNNKKRNKDVKLSKSRRNPKRYNKKDSSCSTTTKGSSRDIKDDINVSNDSDYNDPSWYNASNQLVVDACSLGFATPLGLPLDVHGSKFNIPGICRINYIPSIGLSKDNTSPINLAAQSIYSYVNYANSRNTSYDRTDMMMFMLAMDSAYSYLSTLKRIYGLARQYSATNRYLPLSLIRSMDVDFDDILKNLSDFRAYINTYAWKLGSFFVPASFTYLKRHSWMNFNIFADSDKVFKSQLYYYYQTAYYKYDETTSTKGTSLIYTPAPGLASSKSPATFSDLVTFGDDLLRPLLNSQDIGIMGSDILKAFGDSGLIKMNTIEDDFTVEIAYSPEVLTQIQNTISVGSISISQHAADITQDNGYIIQSLKLGTQSDISPTFIMDVGNYFLNMPMVNPTPDDVMVATRNMAWVDMSNLIHSGSDVVVDFDFFMKPDHNGERVTVTSSSHLTGSDAPTTFSKYYSILSVLPAFNMHPRVILGARSTGNPAIAAKPVILCDFENYTLLPVVDLQKMHEVALLSMFNVPQYGTFNG